MESRFTVPTITLLAYLDESTETIVTGAGVYKITRKDGKIISFTGTPLPKSFEVSDGAVVLAVATGVKKLSAQAESPALRDHLDAMAINLLQKFDSEVGRLFEAEAEGEAAA